MTPGGDRDAAAAPEDDVTRWESEVARLHALRLAISVRHGHVASAAEKRSGASPEPLLLHNHASELANAIRLLDAAKRKRARRIGSTPPARV